MQVFSKKIIRPNTSDGRKAERELFSFEAVAARTFIRIAIARIAYVDFRKRTIVARTVILTFGHAAADTGVDTLHFVVHHKNILLIALQNKDFYCFV